MKKKLKHILGLSLIILFSACAAPKEILYFQDIASLKEEAIDKGYEAVIQIGRAHV